MATTLAVVFGVMAAGLAGLAAWLWRGQGRLAAEAGAARREAEELERQLAAAREAQLAAAGDAERFRVAAEELRDEVASLRVAAAKFEEREASLGREREALEKRVVELREQMGETFRALAGETLRVTGDELLKRAKAQFESQQREDETELEKRRVAVEQMVKPIGETLAATRERLERIEKERAEQFARFSQHMEHLGGASTALREETARLSKALSRPEVRGQYGEWQLRKVAEIAGMRKYCDFSEQESVRDAEGNLLRPDMIVKLPNERVLAVDAKTPVHAYLEAANAPDEPEREANLDRFAKHMAEQAKKLGDKKYWSAWKGSPEFVVMFVPGDHFIDAALSRQPKLIEQAAQQGVILASPSTLIGLLHAVAVGWREANLAEDARELQQLGSELHERAAKVFEYAEGLGNAIKSTVNQYNNLAGSMEGRLAVTLRRFEESGIRSGKDLPALEDVTVVPRRIQALPGGSETRGSEMP